VGSPCGARLAKIDSELCDPVIGLRGVDQHLLNAPVAFVFGVRDVGLTQITRLGIQSKARVVDVVRLPCAPEALSGQSSSSAEGGALTVARAVSSHSSEHLHDLLSRRSAHQSAARGSSCGFRGLLEEFRVAFCRGARHQASGICRTFASIRRVSVKPKTNNLPLTGPALLKETRRRIRAARSYWDAHNNRACRGEREKALALYERLSEDEREKVPQVLRVWLRYRSEKYFGPQQTRSGTGR
jgi:hypothetical protein